MKERKTNQTKNNDNSKTKNCTLGTKRTKRFTVNRIIQNQKKKKEKKN